MSRRLSLIATTVALAAVVATASASGATVELRVESSSDPTPLFEGSVTTLPHAVDGGDGSGPHPCSGPAGSPPSATATGALDDAMRAAGIPWRGNWDPSFRDFFIDRIGPYASTPPDRYWSLTVNGRFSSGGCLARVEDGDSVRFTYGFLFAEPPPTEPGGAGAPGAQAGGDGPAPAAGPATRRVRGIALRAEHFLRRNGDGVGADWARLALALRRGTGLEQAAAALLGGRLGQLRGGSIGGDVNATALAVLALEDRQPRRAAAAARWLAASQHRGGGFGYRPRVAPDVDSTGLATWALARRGREEAARRGGAFLRSTQAADGGFPSLPGGDSNSQSTGLALVGLRSAGTSPRIRTATGRTPLDFLATLARRDGSIGYTARTGPTPTWTTAQALLGLTSREKLLGLGA